VKQWLFITGSNLKFNKLFKLNKSPFLFYSGSAQAPPLAQAQAPPTPTPSPSPSSPLARALAQAPPTPKPSPLSSIEGRLRVAVALLAPPPVIFRCEEGGASGGARVIAGSGSGSALATRSRAPPPSSLALAPPRLRQPLFRGLEGGLRLRPGSASHRSDKAEPSPPEPARAGRWLRPSQSQMKEGEPYGVGITVILF
jgi:hypothetical protein